MFVTLLSSLSARIRDAALEGLRDAFPETVLLCYDLYDASTLTAWIHRPGQAPEVRLLPLGTLDQTSPSRCGPYPALPRHACLACTVAVDAASILAVPCRGVVGTDLARAVVALPPGANGLKVHGVFSATSAGLPLAVDSVALAVDPVDVEPALSSPYLLHRAVPAADDATDSAEFITTTLAHVDTVLAVDDPLWGQLEGCARSGYRAASERGVQLLRELAPHAVVNAPGRVSILGRYDREAAVARVAPGAVGTEPLQTGGPFGTVVLRSARPLHPGRVRQMLRSLSGEVLWVRGRLRLGGCSELRVVLNGAGPRLRIDPAGARNEWDDPAETVLALTGHALDAEWCREAFSACELDGAELEEAASGETALNGAGVLDTSPGEASPSRILFGGAGASVGCAGTARSLAEVAPPVPHGGAGPVAGAAPPSPC